MKTFLDTLITIFKRRSVVAAIIIMILVSASGFAHNKKQGLISLLAVFVYLTVVFLIQTLGKKSAVFSSEDPLLPSLSLEYLSLSDEPVVIVGEKGNIVWHNHAFTNAGNTGLVSFGKNISDVAGQSLNILRLTNVSDKSEFPMDYVGKEYYINTIKVQDSGKTYFITRWKDATEKNKLLDEIEKGKVDVCFIVIDNFSESMQFAQDKYRTATALIAGAIDAWCEKYNGIIKEYDKNHYFLIFKKQYGNMIEAARFDILDKIREISVDGASSPFTASIGFASVDGSLPEKEAAARRALDMALQRGGDQAVVKTNDSTDFFGGKTKTVSKTTKIRARVVAKELDRLVDECKNVVIMGHKFADHDCIGACIAISKLATVRGKQVNIVVNIHDINLKPIFAHMRGSVVYDRMLVDRVHAPDLITSDTLLIVCDVNNPAQFEAPELYEAANRFVVIDHHRKTTEFDTPPEISYIEPSASSASEMVCEMLEQLFDPGELSQVEADLLFAGILLDTKQFLVNTGVRTFGAARYLREEGANPVVAQKLLRGSVEDLIRETKFENNVFIYRDCIAISSNSEPASCEDKIAAAKAADRLLNVVGVSASFVLCNIDNTINISARSDGTINVQLILEALGGGGHFDSAGAQVKKQDISDVVTSLKAAIDTYFTNTTKADEQQSEN